MKDMMVRFLDRKMNQNGGSKWVYSNCVNMGT